VSDERAVRIFRRIVKKTFFSSLRFSLTGEEEEEEEAEE